MTIFCGVFCVSNDVKQNANQWDLAVPFLTPAYFFLVLIYSTVKVQGIAVKFETMLDFYYHHFDQLDSKYNSNAQLYDISSKIIYLDCIFFFVIQINSVLQRLYIVSVTSYKLDFDIPLWGQSNKASLRREEKML